MVIRRFEVIILILIMTVLSSVAVSTKCSDMLSTAPRYPYKIVLSFDDGPHPGYTEKIIDVLSKEDVPATFFVVGKQAEKYPELIQKLARSGHEVANHTYSHANLNRISNSRIIGELERTQDFLDSIIGPGRRKLFRPPGGRYNQRVLDVATGEGYSMVLWTIFPRDHSAPPVELLCRRIFESAEDGDVILLHSGIDSTLEALPKIIQHFRARGFRFLTISELLYEELDPKKKAAWIYEPNSGSNISDLAFNIPPVVYQ